MPTAGWFGHDCLPAAGDRRSYAVGRHPVPVSQENSLMLDYEYMRFRVSGKKPFSWTWRDAGGPKST